MINRCTFGGTNHLGKHLIFSGRQPRSWDRLLLSDHLTCSKNELLQITYDPQYCNINMYMHHPFGSRLWSRSLKSLLLVTATSSVSGEIFGHNWSRSWCFQVQPVTCRDRSFGCSLLIWSAFSRFLWNDRQLSWCLGSTSTDYCSIKLHCFICN